MKTSRTHAPLSPRRVSFTDRLAQRGRGRSDGSPTGALSGDSSRHEAEMWPIAPADQANLGPSMSHRSTGSYLRSVWCGPLHCRPLIDGWRPAPHRQVAVSAWSGSVPLHASAQNRTVSLGTFHPRSTIFHNRTVPGPPPPSRRTSGKPPWRDGRHARVSGRGAAALAPGARPKSGRSGSSGRAIVVLSRVVVRRVDPSAAQPADNAAPSRTLERIIHRGMPRAPTSRT